MEVVNGMLAMEQHQCGTITARELAELLAFRSLLPPGLSVSDLEKDFQHELSVDAFKELESKEVVQALNSTLNKMLICVAPAVTAAAAAGKRVTVLNTSIAVEK